MGPGPVAGAAAELDVAVDRTVGGAVDGAVVPAPPALPAAARIEPAAVAAAQAQEARLAVPGAAAPGPGEREPVAGEVVPGAGEMVPVPGPAAPGPGEREPVAREVVPVVEPTAEVARVGHWPAALGENYWRPIPDRRIGAGIAPRGPSWAASKSRAATRSGNY